MFPFEKLVYSRDIINTVSVRPLSSPLLFLNYRLYSTKFLMDTGASVSVFSHLPRSPSASGSGIQLKTTDGSTMNTYNFRCLAFSLVLDVLSGVFCWQMFLCHSWNVAVISWWILQVPASMTPNPQIYPCHFV